MENALVIKEFEKENKILNQEIYWVTNKFISFLI